MSGKILYGWIDESGDLNCGANGTSHFVMAAVFSEKPARSAQCLQELKYELLSCSVDLPHFHATQDKKGVRTRVLHTLHDKYFRYAGAHIVWVDKRAMPVPRRSQLYSLACSQIGRHILSGFGSEYEQVILVFDNTLQGKRKSQAIRAIEAELNKLKPSCPYRLYFHSVNLDFNGQAADYVAHAAYEALETGKHEHQDILIRDGVASMTFCNPFDPNIGVAKLSR